MIGGSRGGSLTPPLLPAGGRIPTTDVARHTAPPDVPASNPTRVNNVPAPSLTNSFGVVFGILADDRIPGGRHLPHLSAPFALARASRGAHQGRDSDTRAAGHAADPRSKSVSMEEGPKVDVEAAIRAPPS